MKDFSLNFVNFLSILCHPQQMSSATALCPLKMYELWTKIRILYLLVVEET